MKKDISNLDKFTEGLKSLIIEGLQNQVPPEFMVMRLELNKHELSNIHIARVRQKQEAEQAELATSNIVGLNGQPARK